MKPVAIAAQCGACRLWVKGGLRDHAGTTIGVPQIADDLLHRPSRLSWAITGPVRRSGRMP